MISPMTINMLPLDFNRLPPEEQSARSRQFLEQMQTRRTVRQFARDPVPFELIENAVAVASTAPSGANQQPWSFVVVKNAEIKRQIREAAEAEERENYTWRMPQEWVNTLAPLNTDWHKPHLEDAPYLIIVFSQTYGLNPDGSKRKHYYVTESVGIAVGMLLTSLHLAGLATLTHTPSPMGFLTEILHRPENERPFVLIPVGYPAPEAVVPDIKKKSVSDVITVVE
ncbi:MAG: nitroreductase family protein [Anaerolinea sp.]|nr:nitroreductase family protein [Anaerolinea sp.]